MPDSDILLQLTYRLSDLKQVAEQVSLLLNTRSILCFEGDLGAGKTTLITALCSYLGVVDEVSSPSFSLVNEYSAGERTVYHFDFYRIKSEEEAFDMGIEMYLSEPNICLIEWPEKIQGILEAEPRIKIQIRINDDARLLTAFLEK